MSTSPNQATYPKTVHDKILGPSFFLSSALPQVSLTYTGDELEEPGLFLALSFLFSPLLPSTDSQVSSQPIAMSTLPSPVVAPKIVKVVKTSPEVKVLERVVVDLISAGAATLGIAPGMA